MAAKFAERLTILHSVGEGLLARLYATYRDLSGPNRPAFMNDKASAKVLKTLVSSFPSLDKDPQGTQGYSELMGKANTLHECIHQFYFTFVDLEEWEQEAVKLLTNVGKETTGLKYDLNPTLTAGFLALLAMYMRCLFLLNYIADRRTIVAVYARVHYHMKMTAEPSAQKVATFIQRVANLVPHAIHQFKGISEKVAEAIISLYMPYVENIDVNQLRQKGAHNITLNAEKMGLPSEDPSLYNMIQSQDMYIWICYGLLVCPEAYVKVPSDLLRAVLSQGFYVPIFRDASLPIHDYYDQMFKVYRPKKKEIPKQELRQLKKKLKEDKRIPGDAIKDTTGRAAVQHHQARMYLRQELGNLLSLMRDKPGLLGPKMTLVLSALTLARNEVMWLFRHWTSQPPRSVSKHYKAAHYVDAHITDLIYIVDQLVALMKQHRQVIRTYFQEYMRGLDYTTCKEQADKAGLSEGNKVSQLVGSILSEISAISPSGEHDFRALRLNWYRVEASLSAPGSSIFIDTIRPFVQRFTTLTRHSRYADDLDALLSQYSSLTDLWYYRHGLEQVFSTACADGDTQPARCMVFVRLLGKIAASVPPEVPQDVAATGVACVDLATNWLTLIANTVDEHVAAIAAKYASFAEQVKPTNAAFALLQKSPNWKPPKGFQPPVTPGCESEHGHRSALDPLRIRQHTAFQLCRAMNEQVSITVYDTVFTPREFLRDKLAARLTNFLRSVAVRSESTIYPPTVIEQRINDFCAAIKLVENYLDLDVSALIREVLVSQVYHKACGAMGQLDPKNMPSLGEMDPCLLKPLLMFYANFVEERLRTPGIVWSPVRRAFLSKASDKFRAERYADFLELKALARLVGPYGVKVLDKVVLATVGQHVLALKEAVQRNQGACERLNSAYMSGSKCLEELRGFVNTDDFLVIAAAIGLALHFRKLMYEALRAVMQERVPYMFHTVEAAFNQYQRNTFMVQDYVPTDMLAQQAGVDVGVSDQHLKTFLLEVSRTGSATQPGLLWNLLPTMFAASFASKFWAQARFRPSIEAYDNNAHTLALTINELTIAFKACTTQTHNETEIVQLLNQFVEMSAVVLLRFTQLDSKSLEKVLGTKSYQLDPMVIFLDKFVEQSAYLTRDHLESVLPYSVLRTMYKRVYESRSHGKGKKDVGYD